MDDENAYRSDGETFRSDWTDLIKEVFYTYWAKKRKYYFMMATVACARNRFVF